ncbi:uncharacterized protein Bfra_003770 [Botrytis fragariae]|uniref:2EXR domain-containing protein n=1 Tax=Botrytis fragariae TaxID=1964551 RepID=A0A8H6AXK4_9HELO|nr:uncharacterized protein Bfra_003770 [Botrytis fragariae]KAF5875315.1 hypothetical protein Bfra_003770 [Botrytis fragariae]
MDNDGIIRNYNTNHFLEPLRNVTTAAEEGSDVDISFTSLVKHIPLHRTSRDELKRVKPIRYADDSELERICSWPETYTREHQIADLSWHDEVEYAMTADDFFDRAPSTNSCLISASQKKSSDSLSIGNGKKLDTFTCFPRLPPELRLRIWRTMAFVPRVIALQERSVHNATHKRSVCIQTTNAAAKVLQIHHESRTEALKFHKPSFGIRVHHFKTTDYSVHETPIVDELIIHANFQADTIYYDKWYIQFQIEPPVQELPSSPYMSSHLREISKSAHSAAFNISHPTSRNCFSIINKLIRDCTALEEVLLVVRIKNIPSDRTSSGHLELMESNKNEAQVCYERYIGVFIELCDEVDKYHQNIYNGASKANIGRPGGPRVRAVGLMRDGVRI